MSQVEVEAAMDRVTVQEAAYRLGIKDDAVRKRIQRGTLHHEKDSDGRVYVFLDATQDVFQPLSHDGVHRPTGNLSKDNLRDESKDKTINVLEEQIQYLKEIISTRDRELEVRAEELAEMRRIVAALTSRIPEQLPAASPQRSPESDESNTTVNGGQASEPKTGSWWRRLLGNQ